MPVASQLRQAGRLRGGFAFSRHAGLAEPNSLERPGLPACDYFLIEIGNRIFIHAMKVEPRPKAQERAAQADRRALEKHEFARYRQGGALSLPGPHHLAHLASAIFRRFDAI